MNRGRKFLNDESFTYWLAQVRIWRFGLPAIGAFTTAQPDEKLPGMKPVLLVLENTDRPPVWIVSSAWRPSAVSVRFSSTSNSSIAKTASFFVPESTSWGVILAGRSGWPGTGFATRLPASELVSGLASNV